MVTLKETLLDGLARYFQRPPELKVALACAAGGATLVSTPLIETTLAAYIKGKDIPVLSAALRILDFPDIVKVVLGVMLLLAAIAILYLTSLSPQVRRAAALKRLSNLLNQSTSLPAEIQNEFNAVYGFKPDISEIRYVTQSDRGDFSALDLKYSRHLVKFSNAAFSAKVNGIDFASRAKWRGRAYLALALLAIMFFAIGINIVPPTTTGISLVLLSVVLGCVSVSILHALRAYRSAKRLTDGS